MSDTLMLLASQIFTLRDAFLAIPFMLQAILMPETTNELYSPMVLSFLGGVGITLLVFLSFFIRKLILRDAIRPEIAATSRESSPDSFQEHLQAFEQLITEAGEVIFSLNRQGRILYANYGAEKLLNIPQQQLLALSVWDIVPETYQEKVRLFYEEQQLKDQKGGYLEAPFIDANGKWHWLRQYVSALQTDNGEQKLGIIAHNITRTRQMQDALNWSEKRFRMLADQVPIGIMQCDRESEVLYMNAKAEQILGAKYEEADFENWTQAINDENKFDILTRWNQQRFGNSLKEESYKFKYKNLHNGRVHHLVMRIQALSDDKGNSSGYFIGTLEDVTLKYESEKMLAANEQKLEALFENTNDLIGTFDLNNRLVKFNQKFRSFAQVYFNKTLSVGQEWLPSDFPTKERDKLRELFKRALKGVSFRQTYELEYRGQYKAMELDFYPVIEGNQMTGVTIFCRNITESKLAEQQSRRQLAGLRLLNELKASKSNCPDQLIEEGLRSISEYIDMPVGMVFSYSGPEMCQVDYLHNQNSGFKVGKGDCFLSMIHRSLYQSNKVFMIDDYKAAGMDMHPNAEVRKIRAYIGVPLWIKGELYGTIGFASSKKRKAPFNANEEELMRLFARWIASVLEQKYHNESLIRAKENAEKASESRMQFLSAMSHEIRTPLNAIIGMSNLLLDHQPREDQKDSLEVLHYSGKNLLSIIDDILDINKMDAGKLELEQQSFDFKKMLEQSVKMFRSKAQEKQLDLSLDYDPALTGMFRGDEHRLAQVINNLLSNAIKFTEQGQVKLSVKCIQQQQQVVKLQVAVQDSGIGIDLKKQAHVFETFSQESTEITRKYGGTGLGLPIVRNILQLLGTDIQLRSQKGTGSCFYFELELEREEQAAAKSYSEAEEITELTHFDLHVLLAEDNPANQLVARKFLEKWGVRLTLVENGKQALERLQQQDIDLVLMDLQMPVMDGYEATRQIRKLPDAYYQQLPIIALSASVLHEISHQALEAGMNDFLSKPFVPHALNQLLLRQISSSPKVNNKPQVVTVKPKIASSSLVEVLRKLCRDDKTFMKEISALYAVNLEELSEGLVQVLRQENRATFEQLYHKSKPTMLSLELKALDEKCVALCELIQQKGREEELKASAEGALTCCQQVLLQLDNIAEGELV